MLQKMSSARLPMMPLKALATIAVTIVTGSIGHHPFLVISIILCGGQKSTEPANPCIQIRSQKNTFSKERQLSMTVAHGNRIC